MVRPGHVRQLTVTLLPTGAADSDAFRYEVAQELTRELNEPLEVSVWDARKDQTIKGKRHTTEHKIRILREADCGQKTMQDICREGTLSELSFHRWKKQFDHMEVNEAPG